MNRSYVELKAEVERLKADGRVDVWPSQEQRADWAYGNTKIENESITREMAEHAVQTKSKRA